MYTFIKKYDRGKAEDVINNLRNLNSSTRKHYLSIIHQAIEDYQSGCGLTHIRDTYGISMGSARKVLKSLSLMRSKQEAQELLKRPKEKKESEYTKAIKRKYELFDQGLGYCTNCKKVLRLELMAKDRNTKTGYRSQCRACKKLKDADRDPVISTPIGGVAQNILCSKFNIDLAPTHRLKGYKEALSETHFEGRILTEFSEQVLKELGKRERRQSA